MRRALAVLAVCGCEPIHPPFVCHDAKACDTQPGGQCVQSYCAFPDGTCASGLKFDPSAAPELAGTCVVSASDGGVDQNMPDLSQFDESGDAVAAPDMTHVLTWTAQTSGTGAYLADIWGSGPMDIYVVGSGGTILHSKNGTSWTTFLNSPTTTDL
jgi:hypothetical protein